MPGTRIQLLLAAERLFAERGLDGASLREIGAAAGQRNNSAVQYHFGDRDGLVRSLYEWRLEPLNGRRTTLLAPLAGTDAPLETWVEAYARPLFEVADGTSWYARFVARFVALEPQVAFVPPLDARYTSAVRTVERALDEHVKHLAAPLRAERRRRAQLYLTGAIADVEARRARGARLAGGSEASLRDLVLSAAALLTARG